MTNTEWPESPAARTERKALRDRYTIAREAEWGGLMVVRRDGVKVGTTQTERAARLMRGKMVARELEGRR